MNEIMFLESQDAKARGGPLRSCSPNLYSKQSQDIADAVAQMLSTEKGSHGLLATMLLMQPQDMDSHIISKAHF